VLIAPVKRHSVVTLRAEGFRCLPHDHSAEDPGSAAGDRGLSHVDRRGAAHASSRNGRQGQFVIPQARGERFFPARVCWVREALPVSSDEYRRNAADCLRVCGQIRDAESRRVLRRLALDAPRRASAEERRSRAVRNGGPAQR
jgi:hypothetical protein